MTQILQIDHRSKGELLLAELALRKTISELVGRLQYVHAMAESVAAARLLPFSKVSKLARKSIQEILQATIVQFESDAAKHP